MSTSQCAIIRVPDTSIPEIASAYLELIETVSQNGPYILGGWSFGGVVAYEIAYQLTKKKKVVTKIILLDSWARYPIKFNNFATFKQSCENSTHHLIKDKAWLILLWSRVQLLIHYIPNSIIDNMRNFTVYLFKAQITNNDMIEQEDEYNLWGKYINKKILVSLANGDHDSMMDNKNIDSLAKQINQILSYMA